MNERRHVLIGFTPFHLIPMAEIARQLSGQVIMFHPDSHLLPHEIISMPNVRVIGRGRSKIQKYMSGARQLRKIFSTERNVEVYAPHPYNPLSNYALLSCNPRKKNIFQDGLLNYYDAERIFTRRELLGRRAISSLLGLPYRKFSGHLSGIEQFSANAGYFTHPDKIVLKHLFDQINELKMLTAAPVAPSFVGGQPVTLFLDQPIELTLDGDRSSRVRSWAQDFANSLGLPVIYKSHHDQGAANSWTPGWQKLSRKMTGMPVELLVGNLNVANVVGFFSSALVNLSNSATNINCYAIGANCAQVSVNGNMTTLSRLMNDLGVHSIDVNTA